MSLTPRLRPLPEPERRACLEQHLAALDRDENLTHFRTSLTTGPERQLALIAALERSVQLGSPQACPPKFEDQADLLLCDILDLLNRHPDLKRHGSAFGPNRHLATLQALGIWKGNAPKVTPTARELFATAFSKVTSDCANTLPCSDPNFSPVPQETALNGELIAAPIAASSLAADAPTSAQTLDSVVVLSIMPNQPVSLQTSESTGIIRHEAPTPGDKFDLTQIAAKPVRRGRPTALDDTAKGRLLGLMSYGLSFRQAAAQIGVHHQTILNTLKRDEQFAQQVSEARLDAISQPLITVVQASRKNWRAAAWLAKFLSERNRCSSETTPEEYELKRTRSA